MAKRSQQRTQAERRASSQLRLLQAAAEILIEEGFAAATFDRISQRAGYSRGMVTERFGSRDAFVAKAIQSVGDLLDAHGPRIDEKGSAPGGFKDKLNTLFWGLKDSPAKAYFIFLAAVVANRLPQMSHFRQHHRNQSADYISLVKMAQEKQHIDPALNANDLGSLFGCLLLGIAMQAQLDPEIDLSGLQKALNDTMQRLSDANNEGRRRG